MNSGAPVVAAPRQVAGVLRDVDHAEVLGFGRDDPDAARSRHPDVAALVALHPVRDPLLDHAGADSLEEHAAVRERAVGVHVVHLDVRPRRVVDVDERLVRREADAVRHLELVLVDHELDVVRAAAGRDPEDALPAQLALALDAEPGKAPVPRVGEVDRPVGAHADVVGAVQVLALVVVGEQLARAVLPLAPERARDVLADEQVAVRVERHPVALEARPHHLFDTLAGRVLPPDVARHVGEEEVPVRMPDRPFGERKARCDLLDLRVLVDELAQLLGMHCDRHAPSFGKVPRT